ncbi:heparinase [Brevirhabdus pacifica]|uniref:Heparinase n=1 Tax=Brevirhabdus pacifica TaxID=1267768 RepID=A0A1U7DM29_9RHOB|nr:heparinase II/III family protein [Brevirhabdus pacifica]APX91054.1 heparinase [Brevirhabdus pacifica]OWU74604.1 heparinase [Loktanella sp. 22II-4b]
MTPSDGWSGRGARLLNRLHARLSGLAPPAVAFVSQPEPRTIGSVARGRQILAGNYMFAGHLVESEAPSLWDVPMPSLAFEQELHGFGWLDDLAAVGDAAARRKAQMWLNDWVRRYGRGRGPAWTPDLTGRRMIRWINHAIFLLHSQSREASAAYFSSLGHQSVFLSRRWKSASPGLPRFEALTGLLYAGLSLQGMDRHVRPAMRAIAAECREQIDAEGGIPTRNPEELLEVFTMLTWSAAGLSEAGQMAARDHVLAIERIAPTLRALRHADGGLARFHGGGRGVTGRLDHALAASGVKIAANAGLSMGYARISAARTSVIVDAAPPPAPAVSYNAHASTLAFELTSGRRPVIVSCGSGLSFGGRWRQAGRATPLHSTLSIDGFSSSRLGARRLIRGIERELLLDAPTDVRARMTRGDEGHALMLAHNGYGRTHGLSHVRRLELSVDGRTLEGEDTLGAMNDADRRRFDLHLNRNGLDKVGFAIRFHIHPDAEAELDLGGRAISIALRSGEVWVFRQTGDGARLGLEGSVYLERGRLKPRETRQVVLRAAVTEYATRVGWTLAKAQDTPSHIRDLERDEMTPI